MTSARLVSFVCAALLGGLVGACTSGDSDTPAEDPCQEIMAACHEKDDGSDPDISACHSVAHDDDTAECSRQHDACIELCDAAPPVGSGGYDAPESGEGDTGSEGTGPVGDSTGSAESSTGAAESGSSSSDGGGSSTGGGLDPSCKLLGSACHDVATPMGMMCHDIGHDADERACAEVWDACVRACGIE